ncbi:MAG: iron-containing alcohol dehydrogenase [Ruminiclostridium sp.]
MKSFTYFAPTQIEFGCGRINEIGRIVAKFGKRALLVTAPSFSVIEPIYQRVKMYLNEAGVDFQHFDCVIPNPTTKIVTKGADIAKEFGAQVVIGLGGGSSMDTAKAIAVEATHEGTAWDYLHFTDGPTEKTLPIIAVPTTAGTGSQTTPCAVITKTEAKDKSAIWHKNIFPKIAIIDPELTFTMPTHVTVQTGFDAFCHNFEAFISAQTNPMVECMAIEGIRLVARYLPKAAANGGDIEARSNMAWADTLGGLTNASAGVTLPHGLGMQVGGHCPHVTHGEALAAIYPAFTRYTYALAVEKFAKVGRILDASLESKPDDVAAMECCGAVDAFLKSLNLWFGFKDLKVSKEDIRQIADCGQVLGDYKNNPRVASIDEMYNLMMDCYERV